MPETAATTWTDYVPGLDKLGQWITEQSYALKLDAIKAENAAAIKRAVEMRPDLTAAEKSRVASEEVAKLDRDLASMAAMHAADLARAADVGKKAQEDFFALFGKYGPWIVGGVAVFGLLYFGTQFFKAVRGK